MLSYFQDAAAITGYCSTWVALRANDTPTAKHVSENLGQVEQIEANEGMSYGVNDMRDGVNLSRMQVTRPLVLHTEVTNLPNLTGYLRFGRNLPVVRFEDSYNRQASITTAFEERTAPLAALAVSVLELDEEAGVAPVPEAARPAPRNRGAGVRSTLVPNCRWKRRRNGPTSYRLLRRSPESQNPVQRRRLSRHRAMPPSSCSTASPPGSTGVGEVPFKTTPIGAGIFRKPSYPGSIADVGR